MSSQNLITSTVWLVTGCSAGFGASLAKQIFESGHTIIATARNTSSLSYLPDSPRVLKLELDVTSIPSITTAFSTAIEKFGRIGVVINNAGTH
ncbi:hypothetical protein BKA61DRAFT_681637 [Leptodontidium sp. MPI-SDFR-AT-0119]|nr:hypothetical protein BKA61DRAFT_681637 [Leptodontidium sp. MPI-SDFR-AT-0119]